MWQQFRNFLSDNKDKSFQRHYIDDYVVDKEGKLSKKNSELIGINIHFNFKESYGFHRSNISIYEYLLLLHNPKQLDALLHHYIPYSSSVFKPVTREDTASYDSKYRDLYKEIEVRNASQLDIDGKLAALSKYLTVNLKDINITGIDGYHLTYSNLNPSTLPLAMEHFQYLMLSLKTGSHPSSTIDEIDRYMNRVLRKYAERSFRIHYVHDPWRPKALSIRELRINLKFKLIDKNQEEPKYTLNKVLRIRNIDKFKALLNHYQYRNFRKSIPLQPSSAYGYLHDYTTYRNTLQVRMDKALGRLHFLFPSLYINNDSSILDINYYLTQSELPLAIRYLELIIAIFNIGNDTNDKNEIDRFLKEVKEDTYPLIEDRSVESFYGYYKNKIRGNRILITPNTFKLNLNIILKEDQYNFTETLHLEGSESFKYLLDLFNYLSKNYLFISNSPHKSIVSCKNLLYIFDRDVTDPSILNLYYYFLSNDLDTFLIVDHLTTIIRTFKRKISSNPNDNDILDQYLTSITRELASINTQSTNNSQFPISPTSKPLTSKPSTSTSTSSPIKPSSSSSRSSLRPLKTFGQSHQTSDNLTTLTLNLRFLPFGDLNLRDDIQLQDTPRLLSILDHYDSKPDDFDCPDTDDQEVSGRIRTQRDTDGILLGLYDKIGFRYERFKGASICNLTYSKLKAIDISLALLHLELVFGVFGTWSDDTEGGRVLDALVGKARRMILPMVPVVSSTDKGWSDGDDKDDVDDDDPRRVSPADGRLGGASANFPNLLEVEEENISMMEDVD